MVPRIGVHAVELGVGHQGHRGKPRTVASSPDCAAVMTRLYRRLRRSRGLMLLMSGGAARQNLESCVACHAERDCLTCHSAQGGRRFNPHGPGFDPVTLQRKNSQACTACHGARIPSSP